MHLKCTFVEIVNQRSAVVLLNDVDDVLIEFVFESEIDPFFDVRDDDQCAHRRRQVLVRISLEAHVFGEIIRLH